MKYTPLQETAIHEAAHAVASLKFNIPFESIHLAAEDETVTLPSGRVHTNVTGCLYHGETFEITDWMDHDVHAEGYLTGLLAGICAIKKLRPRNAYPSIIRIWCKSDFRDAFEYLRNTLKIRAFIQLDPAARALLPKKLRTIGRVEVLVCDIESISKHEAEETLKLRLLSVQDFVDAHWAEILLIGDALFASPDKMLSREDCLELLNDRKKPSTVEHHVTSTLLAS